MRKQLQLSRQAFAQGILRGRATPEFQGRPNAQTGTAAGMTAADLCVKSTTATEKKLGRRVMVGRSQPQSRTGFHEAGLGISKAFDISAAGIGRAVNKAGCQDPTNKRQPRLFSIAVVGLTQRQAAVTRVAIWNFPSVGLPRSGSGFWRPAALWQLSCTT